MANPKHLKILKTGLKKGIDYWNKWRSENLHMIPDLSNIRLIDVDFSYADLTATELCGSKLSGVNLSSANLTASNLSGVDLSNGYLSGVNLLDADLSYANFSGANLQDSVLLGTDVSKADFSKAKFLNTLIGNTIFGSTNLKNAVGLKTCIHVSPSVIDDKTIISSFPMASDFLRGCGLSEKLIDLYRLTSHEPEVNSTCFLIYSHKDANFTNDLYNNFQEKGIRTWKAAFDDKNGERFRDEINKAITIHHKLILILSNNTIKNEWLANQVKRVKAREKQENRQILFPIYIDNTVLKLNFGWVSSLRRSHYMSDFSNWHEKKFYQKAFEELIGFIKH